MCCAWVRETRLSHLDPFLASLGRVQAVVEVDAVVDISSLSRWYSRACIPLATKSRFHRVCPHPLGNGKRLQGRLLRWCAYLALCAFSSVDTVLARLPSPVRVGRKPGVYATWDECKAQVDGFQGARHKKFPTLQDAQAFVGGGAPPVPSATGGSGNAASGSAFLDSRKKRGSDAADRPSTAAKRQKRAVVDNAGADPVFGASPAIKGRKVYCDGSSRGNGQKGATAGIGVFWGHEVGARCVSCAPPVMSSAQ